MGAQQQQVEGACSIQAMVRGMDARKQVAALLPKQRRQTALKRMRGRTESCRYIQAMVRGMDAREQVAAQRQQVEGACSIQAMVRGMDARKQVAAQQQQVEGVFQSGLVTEFESALRWVMSPSSEEPIEPYFHAEPIDPLAGLKLELDELEADAEANAVQNAVQIAAATDGNELQSA